MDTRCDQCQALVIHFHSFSLVQGIYVIFWRRGTTIPICETIQDLQLDSLAALIKGIRVSQKLPGTCVSFSCVFFPIFFP